MKPASQKKKSSPLWLTICLSILCICLGASCIGVSLWAHDLRETTVSRTTYELMTQNYKDLLEKYKALEEKYFATEEGQQSAEGRLRAAREAVQSAPKQETGRDAAPEGTQAESTISFAEWTRRQKAEYIASSESDKYHRRSCEYVENILDENRVYYGTAAGAERDGKTACSLCRP